MTVPEQTTFSPHSQKHFLDYLRVLHKRRRTAVASLTVIVIAGALYIWTAVPMYEARVQLMIETERPRVVIFKETLEQDSDKADYQETQHKILASRGLATHVLDALNLWDQPEFSGRTEQPGVVRRMLEPIVSAGSSVVARLSRTAPPKPKRAKATTEEPGDRAREIDAFLDHLTVAPVRNSRLVDVKFQSADPKLAADVVNTLADTYIKQNMGFKSKTSKEASDFLTQQLDEQRKRVQASEAALQRYREQTDAMSTSERESVVQQKLNEVNSALTRAQTERRQKEFVFAQLQAAKGNSKELEMHPSVASSTVIQSIKAELNDLQKKERQLRDALGDRHPDLITMRQSIQASEARLLAEEAKVVEAAHNDTLAAQALERNLFDAAEAQKRIATAMRRKQGEYDALEREAASDRGIFESLLQRTKETGVSSEMMASNIRIVDAADVPHTPISPQKVRDFGITLCTGLAFGILAAFASDYLDKRLKTPDEVKTQLGLPCLGLVPSISDAHNPILSNGVPPLFQEAFRAFRTSVLFAAADESSQTLLVTSTGPKEGKTLISTNLAISLAQTGRRVLIIDADLRRPTVHKLLGEMREPGLSGIADPGWVGADAVRRTHIPGLWVLAAGPTPDNPAELLSSERFKTFIRKMAAAYDWVIIDSPPVMAVTDAVLLAHLCGGVLFVVGSETTMGPAALNALEKLNAGRARFLGAVLNRVKLERDPFFYSQYYRSEYQEYYGIKS